MDHFFIQLFNLILQSTSVFRFWHTYVCRNRFYRFLPFGTGLAPPWNRLAPIISWSLVQAEKKVPPKAPAIAGSVRSNSGRQSGLPAAPQEHGRS